MYRRNALVGLQHVADLVDAVTAGIQHHQQRVVIYNG